jgi:hypothetical protein
VGGEKSQMKMLNYFVYKKILNDLRKIEGVMIHLDGDYAHVYLKVIYVLSIKVR